MKHKILVFLFLLLNISWIHCQVINEAFDKKISSVIDFSVPIMTVEDLKEYEEPILILDAREIEEYNISHIPEAIFIGYNDPDYDKLNQIDKRQPIVLYCSIGYRSEKIGEQLLDQGFVNVYNLFGSIFEWANRGNPLVDINQKTTKSIHTYNKNWSIWVDHPDLQKIW